MTNERRILVPCGRILVPCEGEPSCPACIEAGVCLDPWDMATAATETLTPAELAYATVSKVMSANEGRHEPDEWSRRTVEYHLRHAWAHLVTAEFPLQYPDEVKACDVQEELEHAVCRSVMALSVYLQNQAAKE